MEQSSSGATIFEDGIYEINQFMFTPVTLKWLRKEFKVVKE